MQNRFLIVSLLAFLVCAPVKAQDAPVSAPAAASQDKSKELDEMRAQLKDKLTEMSKDMSVQEKQHFQTTYGNYILINTVKTVQTDVAEAVKSCGAKNPDMLAKMDERFAKWNDAVNPVLKDSQGNLDNMVLAQDYASKEDMQAVFNYIDKTRDISRAQIDRVPVTTPEACENLLTSMEETQETMVKLLSQTLMTFPKLYPDAGTEKKPE